MLRIIKNILPKSKIILSGLLFMGISPHRACAMDFDLSSLPLNEYFYGQYSVFNDSTFSARQNFAYLPVTFDNKKFKPLTRQEVALSDLGVVLSYTMDSNTVVTKIDSLSRPDTASQRSSSQNYFLEIVGGGFVAGSFNFETMLSKYLWGRIGVGLGFGSRGEDFFLVPIGALATFFGSGSSKFEIGGGCSLFMSPHSIGNIFLGYEDGAKVSLFGIIGYRFQVDGGFLFRITFTPTISPYKGKGLPLFGISIGWNF